MFSNQKQAIFWSVFIFATVVVGISFVMISTPQQIFCVNNDAYDPNTPTPIPGYERKWEDLTPVVSPSGIKQLNLDGGKTILLPDEVTVKRINRPCYGCPLNSKLRYLLRRPYKGKWYTIIIESDGTIVNEEERPVHTLEAFSFVKSDKWITDPANQSSPTSSPTTRDHNIVYYPTPTPTPRASLFPSMPGDRRLYFHDDSYVELPLDIILSRIVYTWGHCLEGRPCPILPAYDLTKGMEIVIYGDGKTNNGYVSTATTENKIVVDSTGRLVPQPPRFTKNTEDFLFVITDRVYPCTNRQ